MSNKHFHLHFEIKINISGADLYKVDNEVKRFKEKIAYSFQQAQTKLFFKKQR